MNWDAIGAIGEAVSALAVVITLIYLARQIHSSSKATESQVHASLSAEMERLATTLASDTFLANAMLAARRQESLEPEQELRLGFWFGGFLRVCESHYLQRHLEATEIDLESPIAVILKGHAEVPFLRGIMQNGVDRGSATKEFLAWLDKNVLQSDT